MPLTVDHKLNFEEHSDKFCKRVNQKILVLAKVSSFMSQNNMRVLKKPVF